MSERQGFQGRIGLTHLDSVPHWAPVRTPAASAPNVVYRGPRRRRVRRPRLLRLGDRHADDRPARGRRAALHQLPRDAAVLTHPGVPADRTEPPLGRHAHAVANCDTGFPSGRGHVTQAAGPSPRSCATPATTRCASASGTSRRPSTRPLPVRTTSGRSGGASSGTTASSRPRPISFYPELVVDNHRVDPPARPEDGYHLTTDLVDQAIALRPRPDLGDAGEAVLPLSRVRRRACPIRRRTSTSTSTGVGSMTAGTPYAKHGSRGRSSSGVIPPEAPAAAAQRRVSAVGGSHRTSERLFARLQEAYAAMIDHTDASWVGSSTARPASGRARQHR